MVGIYYFLIEIILDILLAIIPKRYTILIESSGKT